MGLKIVVCINKIDLDEENETEPIKAMLRSIPYDFICTSAKHGIGISELKEKLRGNISVFAG
ncbi:MAG TPA: ribosome small subunit-dependent GTPase A, partial [Clostridiaceae bacterium]|nr:ribosome small subunit-dependent GTPase A [Clostridiaceae bacterium]